MKQLNNRPIDKLRPRNFLRAEQIKSKIIFNALCRELVFGNRELRQIQNQMQGFEILDHAIELIIINESKYKTLEENVINTLNSFGEDVPYNFVKRGNVNGEYLLSIFLENSSGTVFVFEIDFDEINDLKVANLEFNKYKQPPVSDIPKDIFDDRKFDFRFGGNGGLRHYHFHTFDEMRTEYEHNKKDDLVNLREKLFTPMTPTVHISSKGFDKTIDK
jgi:hypothetical protein